MRVNLSEEVTRRNHIVCRRRILLGKDPVASSYNDLEGVESLPEAQMSPVAKPNLTRKISLRR